MLKKSMSLLALIIMSGLCASEEAESPRSRKRSNFMPQPGWIYNDTNNKIVVREKGTEEALKYIEPHELRQLESYKGKFRYVRGRSGNRSADIYYYTIKRNQEKGKMGFIKLNEEVIGNLGSEYVIIFKNAPESVTELSYAIMPEKEFKDKYAKELEAYPVPGPLQRLIGEYILPRKTAQEPESSELSAE